MDCPSGNEYKVSVTGFAFVSSLAHTEMPKPPSSGRRWRRRRRRIGASVLSLYFRAYPQDVTCLPFCFLCYSRYCGNSHFGACRTTFLRSGQGGRFSHHAADAVAGFSFPAAGGLPKLPSEPARSVGGTHRLVRQHMTDRTRAPKGA